MSYYDDASLVFIPSGYKTSKAYSIKPTDGSGDLTFSRSNDTATRVNSAGLIEKVRTNLLTYSNNFSSGYSNFNSTTSASTTPSPDGTTNAARLVALTSGVIFRGITASGIYTFSVFAKYVNQSNIRLGFTDGLDYETTFNIQNGTIIASGATLVSKIENYGNGWYRCSISRTLTGPTPNVYFGATILAGDFDFYGAQLETGDIATSYIATTSAAVSVGPVANVPRLDYLNSSCPRLLLEPQRTNLLTYSEQFDNAAWGKASSGTALAPVVTANNAISPDGYQNADTIVFDAGAGTTASDSSALFQTFGGTTATYTGSFYAKTASGTAQIQVRIDGNNYDKFTITNQWQRFTLTKALTGTGNVFEMVIRRGLNEPMNASATIQLWGVQVELGAYATSYIPTLGAAVTRGADAASKTSASALIGQTEGTVFVDINFDNSTSSFQVGFAISDNAGPVNKHVWLGRNNYNFLTAFLRNTSYYIQYSPSSGGITSNGRHKMAIAYASNNAALYIDGVQIATSSSVVVPTMNQAEFGLFAASIDQADSKINQALLFKTRLTNAQLAELTTI